MSDEGLHDLSALLPGGGLPQQLLLPHFRHPHPPAEVARRLPQVPDERRAAALVVEEEHLQVAEREDEDEDVSSHAKPTLLLFYCP